MTMKKVFAILGAGAGLLLATFGTGSSARAEEDKPIRALLVIGGCYLWLGYPAKHNSTFPTMGAEFVAQFAPLLLVAYITIYLPYGMRFAASGIAQIHKAGADVILMEPQFKPSTERQAVARVRRMGQTRKVNAHRLIAQGTIDEALVLQQTLTQIIRRDEAVK